MDKALKATAIYLAWMLATLPVFPQRILAPIMQTQPTSSCASLSRTHIWLMYNASNTCGGGSACTNGAGLDTVVDSGSGTGINLFQSTSANRPVYTTGAINGLAAGLWNSSGAKLEAGAVIPSSTMTWFAVWKLTSLATSPFTGNDSGGGAFEYRINGTGHQEILKALTVSIGTGTMVFSTGTWYATMVTYDGTNWAFYNCSSGTCASDGSGTNAQGFSSALDRIGFQPSDGPFNGYIAEISEDTAISTTGYGARAQGCYGI